MTRRFLSCLALTVLGSTILLIALCILLVATVNWWAPHVGQWFEVSDAAPPSDAIVVLGGSTLRRMDAALALYKQGLAPRLVITGDTRQQPESLPNEALLARTRALSQGVPEAAITLLVTSSTSEDAEQIARFAQQIGARRIVLVSDWQHGRRALCTVQRAVAPDKVAVAFTAALEPFTPDTWWQSEQGLLDIFTEGVKLGYYGLHYRLPVWDCLQSDMNVAAALALWILGCLLSLGCAVVARRWALHRNILDIPNERSAHTMPIPRGGGLGIASVTLVLFAVILVAKPDLPVAVGVAYILSGAVIAGIGWLDDTHTLPVSVRFGVQTSAVLILVLVGGAMEAVLVPPFGIVTFGVVPGFLLTLLWLTGLTNAFNFMDGIDGLAGTQALIAGLSWCALLLVDGQVSLALLAGLIAATSLGFLWLNAPPARIFMGDVGSTFLGFTLAVLPVLAYQTTKNPRLWVAGALFVAPFVFDTALTVIRRALRRENILKAHFSHLYQRLIKLGWSHARVTGLYGLLALVSVFGGFAYYGGGQNTSIAAVLLVIGVQLALVIGVTGLEGTHRESAGHDTATIADNWSE